MASGVDRSDSLPYNPSASATFSDQLLAVTPSGVMYQAGLLSSLIVDDLSQTPDEVLLRDGTDGGIKNSGVKIANTFDPASATQIPTAAAVASYIGTLNFKPSKEWYVDPVAGVDTSTGGAPGAPFKTIAYALTRVGNTGEALRLYPGTYPEPAFTVTDLNVDLLGTTRSGLVNITNQVTFNHSASSIRCEGVSFAGGLVHSGAGGLYLFNTAGTNINKTGAGYLEVREADHTLLTTTGAGFVNIVGGKIPNGITANHAGAIVRIDNMLQTSPITATLGTVSVEDGVVFSSSPTGFAIDSTANTYVSISGNVRFVTPAGAAARIRLRGQYAITGQVSMATPDGSSTGSILAGTDVSGSAFMTNLSVLGALNVMHPGTTQPAAEAKNGIIKFFNSSGVEVNRIDMINGTTTSTNPANPAQTTTQLGSTTTASSGSDVSTFTHKGLAVQDGTRSASLTAEAVAVPTYTTAQITALEAVLVARNETRQLLVTDSVSGLKQYDPASGTFKSIAAASTAPSTPSTQIDTASQSIDFNTQVFNSITSFEYAGPITLTNGPTTVTSPYDPSVAGPLVLTVTETGGNVVRQEIVVTTGVHYRQNNSGPWSSIASGQVVTTPQGEVYYANDVFIIQSPSTPSFSQIGTGYYLALSNAGLPWPYGIQTGDVFEWDALNGSATIIYQYLDAPATIFVLSHQKNYVKKNGGWVRDGQFVFEDANNFSVTNKKIGDMIVSTATGWTNRAVPAPINGVFAQNASFVTGSFSGNYNAGDVALTQRTNNTLVVASNTITLPVGTWELEAFLTCDAPGGVGTPNAEFFWATSNNAQIPNTSLGRSSHVNWTNGSFQGSDNPARGIITVAAQTVVKVRAVSSNANNLPINASASYFSIKQINAPALGYGVATTTRTVRLLDEFVPIGNTSGAMPASFASAYQETAGMQYRVRAKVGAYISGSQGEVTVGIFRTVGAVKTRIASTSLIFNATSFHQRFDEMVSNPFVAAVTGSATYSVERISSGPGVTMVVDGDRCTLEVDELGVVYDSQPTRIDTSTGTTTTSAGATILAGPIQQTGHIHAASGKRYVQRTYLITNLPSGGGQFYLDTTLGAANRPLGKECGGHIGLSSGSTRYASIPSAAASSPAWNATWFVDTGGLKLEVGPSLAASSGGNAEFTFTYLP